MDFRYHSWPFVSQFSEKKKILMNVVSVCNYRTDSQMSLFSSEETWVGYPQMYTVTCLVSSSLSYIVK